MPERDTIIKAVFAQRDDLLAVAYAMTRDWTLAEDVVQEAFVTMVERWEDVDNPAGVVSWGKQIVRYKALESLRARRKAPVQLTEAQIRGDELAPHLGTLLTDHDSDETGPYRHALLACLSTLKPEHRHLLHGFYWEQQTTDQLASEMGYTGTNIRTMLNRLRSKLDACVRLRLQATR